MSPPRCGSASGLRAVAAHEGLEEFSVLAARDRVDRGVQLRGVDATRERRRLGAQRGPPRRIQFRDRKRAEHLIERRTAARGGLARDVGKAQRGCRIFRICRGDQVPHRNPLRLIRPLGLGRASARARREEREAAYALALHDRFECERVLHELRVVAGKPRAERRFGFVERDEVSEARRARVLDRAIDALALARAVAAHASDVGAERDERAARHERHRVDERPRRFEVQLRLARAAEPRRHQRAQHEQPRVHARRRRLRCGDLRAKIVYQHERGLVLPEIAEHQHAEDEEVDALHRGRVGRKPRPHRLDFLVQDSRVHAERAGERGDRPQPRMLQARCRDRATQARARTRSAALRRSPRCARARRRRRAGFRC